MVLHTVVRDCLYLNWALPRTALPPAPEPLRYEAHREGGEDWVFVSALLFRQEGLRAGWLPGLRLSYPQCNLRSYVIDGDGVPGVLFARLLVPAWAAPAARWVGRVPCRAASLRYPHPSRAPEAESWPWRVASGERSFGVVARQAAPSAGAGPDLGGWQRTTDHFRRRERGYVGAGAGLRRIDTSHGSVPLWPVQAEVLETSLLAGCWPGAAWPALHSAWLCPEIPLTFELVPTARAAVPRQVPAPG